MNVREIGWGGMDWINLAQDRDQWRCVVSTVVVFRMILRTSRDISLDCINLLVCIM
jgi:hypothetical protein